MSLSDEVIVLLYSKVVLPWEQGLKSATGCWNMAVTKRKLAKVGVVFESAKSESLSAVALQLRSEPNRNFFVFVERQGQARDLFGHIRNAFAHAGVHESRNTRRGKVLRFQSLSHNRTTVAMEGELNAAHLPALIDALVVAT